MSQKRHGITGRFRLASQRRRMGSCCATALPKVSLPCENLFMATKQQSGDYAYDHVVMDDGAVAFRCSIDAAKWRFLDLPLSNQITLQAINYFVLTSVSKALGAMDDNTWSALTSFHWRVLRDELPSHGVADAPLDRTTPDYACTFFNADGAPVARVGGTGVVFRNRDFESWRMKAKQEVAALPEPTDFAFAAAGAVGVETQGEVFVGPLASDGDRVAALITEKSGFPPAHPYHDGSGDHVNSGHMCDTVQQAAMLIRARDGKAGYPTAGDVSFRRYVELGRAFDIVLEAAEVDGALTFGVAQGQHSCATVKFRYD